MSILLSSVVNDSIWVICVQLTIFLQIEKLMQVMFQAFLDIIRLMPKAQSAYRKYHSTETATARVYNDLLLATADRRQVAALCLLDLSAAFDTLDHVLLLRRLECRFGLRSGALVWFRSYL